MLKELATSFIWRKALMALTGLMWLGFVFLHMLGNLLIFGGPQAYNKYSHLLISNPFLPAAEILLVLLLSIHFFTGGVLWIQNFRAKPQKYSVSAKGDKSSGIPSRTMIFTGAFVLAFLVLHIAFFKYGVDSRVVYDGVEVRDLYTLVLTAFSQPGYVAWYLVALLLVGLHLSHGFSSAFQSLGVYHPRFTPVIEVVGVFYAVVVSLGFIAIPVYIKFFL